MNTEVIAVINALITLFKMLAVTAVIALVGLWVAKKMGLID